MINLIPTHARKKVTQEYWVRVITVWMFLITFALVLVAVLQIPTYVLINSVSTSLETEFSDVQYKQEAFQEAEIQISQTNTLVKHIDQQTVSHQFSTLIQELDSVAGTDIKITQFSLASEEDSVGIIMLVGNAETRIALSNFRDRLEEHILFAAVELPISNLVKDKDITFSMQVTLAELQ